ncbi:uncharacterized protein [Blastocystis hominis]|uniref:RING-type domain-containing protein n=1 Tax=Blastocystis hominis TaxID=12968 RepID=D8LX61_BLAHO|nr:uncharacterized protein [Blastocystis hominis]CBK20856.2 unnamed protein product [Blastocystis hominis]|eukprot:XP_012894904.1 uncharacterized protein [Blastocystis hominis]
MLPSLFCAYCFQEIQDATHIVSLQFSPEQVVTFHPKCYKSYRAKFALLQNVIRCINDGSYIVLTGVDCNVQNRLEQKRPLATLSLAVPNQSERDYVCPICFEHVADQLLLPCHHRLCAECLLDWRRKSLLKKHKGTQCCFCRQTIQDIEVLSL